MVATAEAGDERAKLLVQRYHHRPRLEFYDVVNDPLEMRNLAHDSKYQAEIHRLEAELQKWMNSQGDKGMETELAANSHIQKKRRLGKKAKQNKN